MSLQASKLNAQNSVLWLMQTLLTLHVTEKQIESLEQAISHVKIITFIECWKDWKLQLEPQLKNDLKSPSRFKFGIWVWSWKERQYSCRVYGVFSDHFSFWMLMSLVPPIVDEGAAWEAINAAPSPYLKFFTCDQAKFAVWFCEVRGHYVKVKMCFRIYMSFVDF